MKRNPAAANLAGTVTGTVIRWVFFRKTGACESVCVLGRVLTLLQLGGCAKEPWRVFGQHRVRGYMSTVTASFLMSDATADDAA